MDSDPECRVAGQGLLDRHSRLDRLQGTPEEAETPVAEIPEKFAAPSAERLFQRLPVPGTRAQGRSLVPMHERGVAGRVGQYDRGKPAAQLVHGTQGALGRPQLP